IRLHIENDPARTAVDHVAQAEADEGIPEPLPAVGLGKSHHIDLLEFIGVFLHPVESDEFIPFPEEEDITLLEPGGALGARQAVAVPSALFWMPVEGLVVGLEPFPLYLIAGAGGGLK